MDDILTSDNYKEKKELVDINSGIEGTYSLTVPQKLNRNFNNPNTYIPRQLIFHKTGAGKTCTAVSIAEGFINYRNQNNLDYLVYFIGPGITRDIFIETLLGSCGNIANGRAPEEDNKYISNEDKEKLFQMSKKKSEKDVKEYRAFRKEKVFNKIYQAGYRIKSYQKIINETIDNFDNCVIIIDEVHNLLNQNNYYKFIKEVLEHSKNTRVILLTATPMYNSPKDIVDIINLLYKKNEEVSKADLFNQDGSLKEGSLGKIQDKLKGIVSYIPEQNQESREGFPMRIDIGKPLTVSETTLKTRIVRVPMSQVQFNVYKLLYNGLVTPDIRSIVNIVFPPSSSSKLGIYSDIENTLNLQTNEYKERYDVNVVKMKELEIEGGIFNLKNLHKYSGKYAECIRTIIEECYDGPNFIYSTRVHGWGIKMIGQILKENGFTEYDTLDNEYVRDYQTFKLVKKGPKVISAKYVLIHQDIDQDKRKEIIDLFNSIENRDGRLIKIIIGSQLTKESVTLKRVNYLHIFGYQDNFARLAQIIGRVVRYKSHDDVPNKVVYVRKYVSSLPYGETDFNPVLSANADPIVKKYAHKYSMEEIEYIRDELNYNIIEKIRDAISEISIENTIDYDKSVKKDSSTYFFYKEFEKYDIKQYIKQIFKKNIFISQENLVNNLNMYTEDMVIYTVNDMIKSSDLVINETGIEGYIIKLNDTFWFQPKGISNFSIDFNTRKFGTTSKSKDITDLVIEYNNNKDKTPDLNELLKTLEEAKTEAEFIDYISILDIDSRVLLVEKALIEYNKSASKKDKSIEPIYYSILKYYKNYLIDENELDEDFNNSNRDEYFTSMGVRDTIDPKKKLIGHNVDNYPKILVNGKFKKTTFDELGIEKKKFKNYKDNDIIVGYMDKNNKGEIVFKLRQTGYAAQKDKRLNPRGFVCGQTNDKNILLKIMSDLGMSVTSKDKKDKKIVDFCDEIQQELIKRQIEPGNKLRWYKDYRPDQN